MAGAQDCFYAVLGISEMAAEREERTIDKEQRKMKW
jgi:hypothetical protein